VDESGGSGQPRSGNDGATERHAGPSAPPADTVRPESEPQGDHDHARPESAGPEGNHARPESAGPDGNHSQQGSTRPDSDHARPESTRPDREPSATDAAPSTAAQQPDGTAPVEPRPDGNRDQTKLQPDGNTDQTGPAFDAHADAESNHDHPGIPGAAPRTLATSGTTKGRPPRRPKDPGGGILMGRPFGVPVYVAPSWFLVAALITWVFGGQLDRVLPELGALRYLVSLFFAVAFYASVLVHELAHTVAALRFKLPVRRIQLQFFGGVSEIEKESETPGREFVLAFVGPLLSLVLSGLFYLAMQTVEPGTVPGVLLAGLMISNLIVAAFNLLPGLPLDGGRMLRAVVWKITGRPMSGTVAAAWVGRALAVSVLIGLPLLTQSGALGSNAEDIGGMDTVTDALLAAILAAIIWTGAGNSLRMARLREHLPELRARNLTRRAVPVQTDTPLSEALRRANDAGARALVVVDADGEPLSLVREAAIVGVPEHRRPWVAVSGLAQDLTDGMRVSAELAGEDLLDTLRATPATEYLVVEESGEIYGVLSAADVERAFVKAMARPS